MNFWRNKGLNIMLVSLLFGVVFFPGVHSNEYPLDCSETSMQESFNCGYQGMTWDGANLWIVDSCSCTINRLENGTLHILDSINISGVPLGLAWDGTYFWVSVYYGSTGEKRIVAVDPFDGSVLYNYSSPSFGVYGLTWIGNYLWVSEMEGDDEKIYMCRVPGLSPSPDLEIVASFPSPGDSSEKDPTGITWDGTHLWLADRHYDEIYALDINHGLNVLCTFDSPGPSPRGLAWDGTSLWNADLNRELIYPLDFHCSLPFQPDKPSGQTTVLVNKTYFYETRSVDPDDDMIRYGWDWNGDNIIDEWTGYYPSGQVVSVENAWSEIGVFNVTVIAEDNVSKAQSSWSESLVINCIDGNPPNKPDKPLGRTSGDSGIVYVYQTSTIDPDGDQIWYQWDWGDGTPVTWVGPYDSGETCENYHGWINDGTYQIKVKVKDEFGLESEWSDPLSVYMPKMKPGLSMLFYYIFHHSKIFSLLRCFLSSQMMIVT